MLSSRIGPVLIKIEELDWAKCDRKNRDQRDIHSGRALAQAFKRHTHATRPYSAVNVLLPEVMAEKKTQNRIEYLVENFMKSRMRRLSARKNTITLPQYGMFWASAIRIQTCDWVVDYHTLSTCDSDSYMRLSRRPYFMVSILLHGRDA